MTGLRCLLFPGERKPWDEHYAPLVAALYWTLKDGSGNEIAYLNQRVRGERDAWAYGSPAMLQTIGNDTAADLSPFLGQPSIIPTTPLPTVAATAGTSNSSTAQTIPSTNDVTEQLAHSSDLAPIVTNQAVPVPRTARPPTTAGDRRQPGVLYCPRVS